MKKTIVFVSLALCLAMLFGCEALSLSENVQPYFTGPEYQNTEEYYKQQYYPASDFEEAPDTLFKPMGYGAEYIDKPLIIKGVIGESMRVDGVKFYEFETDYGTMYISNRLFTLEKFKSGETYRIYFVYTGYNKTLEAVTGAYVSYIL